MMGDGDAVTVVSDLEMVNVNVESSALTIGQGVWKFLVGFAEIAMLGVLV